jgi:hypothetical protein
VGLNSLKSLNLTNVYPNNKKKNKKNKVKSKPLELAGKKLKVKKVFYKVKMLHRKFPTTPSLLA